MFRALAKRALTGSDHVYNVSNVHPGPGPCMQPANSFQITSNNPGYLQSYSNMENGSGLSYKLMCLKTLAIPKKFNHFKIVIMQVSTHLIVAFFNA